MADIHLYIPLTQNYYYSLKNDPVNHFIKDLSKRNDASKSEALIIECLTYINNVVLLESTEDYFNIVRIITFLDAIFCALPKPTNEQLQSKEPSLSRIFADEAGRLILTRYDELIANKKIKTTIVPIGEKNDHRFRFSAKPSKSESEVELTRTDIIIALRDFFGCTFNAADYPENYQFSTIGNYTNLSDLFYILKNPHKDAFQKSASSVGEKIHAPQDYYEYDRRAKQLLATSKDSKADPSCLLLFCQFFDIAWPLAFFVPLVGWGYLAVRLYNKTDRLTNERYSLFSCCSEDDDETVDLPLAWAMES